MADVTVSKSAINSIFLTHFSSEGYPYVWGCSLPLNFFVLFLYNRFLKRVGCFRLFASTVFLTLCLHICLALRVRQEPWLAFIAYMWKDIYVLLLFHQLWAVIHSTIGERKARYLYGIFFGLGSIGGVAGGVLVRVLAVPVGSEGLLFVSIPFFGIMVLSYYFVIRFSGKEGGAVSALGEVKRGDLAGFGLIARSRHLRLILVSVIFMQLAVTIMDYLFNRFLETTFPDQDLRTRFCGKMWPCVEAAAFILQFFATFLLVRLLGMERSRLLLPLAVISDAIICLIFPGCTVFSYAFGAVKVLDYSLFQVMKEYAYVRLTEEEKFRARSVIDVFAYRAAKGIAAATVALLGFLSYRFLTVAVLLIGLLWFRSTYRLTYEVRDVREKNV